MKKDIPAYAYNIIKILVDKKSREEILGDLAEKYDARLSGKGQRAANRGLWCDLAASVAPFLLVRLYQLINAIMVLSKALDLIRRD
jgi:hypothetical protein